MKLIAWKTNLMVHNAKNKERMEREKVITLLRLVKENDSSIVEK